MKRFLSIAVMCALSAPAAFAQQVLNFTDPTPVDLSGCNSVPKTATITLPASGSLAAVDALPLTTVGHAMRKQLGQNGYCANVLVSDPDNFTKALSAKDATGQTVLNYVAAGTAPNGLGMLFAIQMNVVLPEGAPLNSIQTNFRKALNTNDQASADSLNAEASTPPPASGTPLTTFLNMTTASQGGSIPLFQKGVIIVVVDGRTGVAYYIGPKGNLQGPIAPAAGSASSVVSQFVQNMVSIWYGNTNYTPMDPDHRPFEACLLGTGSCNN